ncbi:CRAL TRIO domain containing protein [Asbolus verrucosus]|uniref:CRAL TRIO domain containing protein n=1 Tax=Asbolus verrucosus TaxID=1661398 RepID=A0A482VZ22_ASBVE|nr:CRAL TRIO domain containing protein [Asbolus verrucosus]
MTSNCADLDKLYEKDPNLKREDVQTLKEWIKKQPHLPELKEMQLVIFLHSCYYRIEPTKTALDSYFTVKTHCPDLFEALSQDVFKRTLSVGFLNILPKRTPENYAVMLMKLIDFKTDNFNFINMIRSINMISTLHLHQYGYEDGVVVLFDMKGFTLGHLTRINLTAFKKALYHLQEGAPVRLKSIHFINVVAFIDKVVAMVKPFLKQELYDMLNFHSNSVETLYKYVPKECLPKDYGGEAPSVNALNETCIKNVINNFDFFAWHDSQKVDESKRYGKPKNASTIFGVEGTFKKLEID